MLGISAAAQYVSAPGQSYSVAAFKEPMRLTLGISETDYSLAYAFATIVSGLSLPFVGRLVDRFGARRVLPTIGVLLGTACLGMSQVTTLGGLYVAFSFVRSLGQGALTLVAAWLVGEWFEIRRGFATAIAGLGGSLSVMSFPLINRFLIAQFGWQTGWLVLAGMVWLILVLPGILFIRDRPEDIGLLPDGIDRPPKTDVPTSSTSKRTPHEKEPQTIWAVRDVLRDKTFWKLLCVPATSGMVGTGLVFHQVSLLGSRGVSAGWALGLISLQAAVATLAAIGAGLLTDRYQNRFLLAIAMLLLAVATTTVLVMPFAVIAILYAVLLGLHGSILRSAGSVVWLTYYGRNHQGAIRGVAMAVMILGAAVGPLPLALAVDELGSYDAALIAFTIVPLLSCALVCTARPPEHKPTNTAGPIDA